MTLNTMARQFPAMLVTGPRQVGKTALVRYVFPDAEYLSLDLPSIAAQAESAPESFLRRHDRPLIIDEVQYAPSLFRYLKAVIDENHYLFHGGYPELYASPSIDSSFWYGSYLTTYLERDVRNILNVGNLRDFDRFLRAVASRTAQILSYSDLARDVGIAPNTAKKWVSVLQASGQIFLLEPYFKNIGKRLVKSPKLYLCDTGLAAFLMGFENWEGIARHPVIGALWETHVVMKVVKHC